MKRVLDLFSGIGGFSLGLERTGGFKTVGFCEIDPFCRSVLARHWPDISCHDDVTTMTFHKGMADVIVGGFPCQDVSLAGKRAGLSGSRSGLYRELVQALRVVRPKHAIVENVAALLANGMGVVLGDLAEIGFDSEWDCVPACAIGAPHERDRVYIIAHPARLGCGSGGTRRPPDGFAWVRDEARRNATDPKGARLAFRQGLGRDVWEERQAAQRDAGETVEQSIWPDEPALLGVDDGVSDRVDRVRALGNSIIPRIPEMIGQAILDQDVRQPAEVAA